MVQNFTLVNRPYYNVGHDGTYNIRIVLMSQIQELNHLISIAKYPKNREVLLIALTAANREEKRQKEIARCLARQEGRAKRRAERFAKLSAHGTKRVKTNDLRLEWAYANWHESGKLKSDEDALHFFHWAKCDRKFWVT